MCSGSQAMSAVVAQAQRRKIDLVQRCDDPVHFIVGCAALASVQAGQGLVPEHTPFDEFHHVEGPAQHRLVLAQAQHLGHRHLGAGQRVHDAKFALDCMGRGQQPGRRSRLGPHHIGAIGRGEFVGGI
jgi:hypothetical protein